MKLELDMDTLLAELLSRPEAVAKMVDALYPYFRQKMIHTPALFGGSADRVTVEPNVVLMNTFFNVRSGRVHIGSGTFFGHDVNVLTVMVKKSDRLLFVSFWFARQSVSGLFLLPASTVGASFG